MRLILICLGVLAMLIVALIVPRMSTRPAASACALPATCMVSAQILARSPRATYLGPLPSVPMATFAELKLLGNVGVTLPVSVSFTVNDSAGSNQGFVALIGTSGYSSSQIFSFLIRPSQFAVAAPPSVFSVCAPTMAGCGAGIGVAGSVGQTLDANPAVAVQCPSASTGVGAYDVRVPISMTLTALQVELLSNPINLTGGFSVTVTQPRDLAIYTAFGCPASPAVTIGSAKP